MLIGRYFVTMELMTTNLDNKPTQFATPRSTLYSLMNLCSTGGYLRVASALQDVPMVWAIRDMFPWSKMFIEDIGDCGSTSEYLHVCSNAPLSFNLSVTEWNVIPHPFAYMILARLDEDGSSKNHRMEALYAAHGGILISGASHSGRDVADALIQGIRILGLN